MTEPIRATFIERIKSGEKLVGTVVTLPCPELIEGLVKCGFDWLWIDMEHAPLSLREAQQMLQATHGRAHGLVRVPACDPVWIRQVLDLGADGVIVPLVQSAADAARAVTASKYPPSGTRGVGMTRATGYGLELESYIAGANNGSAVILQVEHIDAVKNIDAILGVPGVDGILIGPYDLSGSMNLLGQVRHPEARAAIESVKFACIQRKVPVGIFTMNAIEAKALFAEGFNFVAVGVDAAMLLTAAKQTIEQIIQ